MLKQTFFAVVFLVCACDAAKLWTSKNPRPNDLWRVNWNIDTSTYKGGDSVSAISNPGGRGRVNAISLSQGSYFLTGANSGTQFYAAPAFTPTPPVQDGECLTLSYMVWFEAGFDFAFGGKLPGLYGGGVNCTAGTSPGKDCFMARFIWRTGGEAGVNVFAPDVTQDASFCDSSVECNQVWGHKPLLSYVWPQASWRRVNLTVRLNTPGVADGYIRVHVQFAGVLFTANDVMFRSSADTKIDGIYFSNYFGGNSACSASPQDQAVLFKGFQLKDNFC